MLFNSRHSDFAKPIVRLTRAWTEGSLSDLRISLVWPSHSRSARSRSTATFSSSTPFCGTTCAKTHLVHEQRTTRHFTTSPLARASSRTCVSVSTSSLAWMPPFVRKK